jgi:hypothetical protein
MRLKNLSPDILNNNMMMEFEHMARTKAEENQGNFMIFEVSDCLREKIQEMNEIILTKLKEFDDKNSLTASLAHMFVSNSDTPLTFTPVTQESFAKWC